MSSGPVHVVRTFSMRPLAIGFACTLALGLATMGVAVTQLGRGQQAAAKLADEGQYATYYLGDIGVHLARLRMHLALSLQGSPEEIDHRARTLSKIDSTLQEEIDALSWSDPALMQRWTVLRPDVERLRGIYREAATLFRTGQPDRAADLLRQSMEDAARVQDALDELSAAHREVMLEALRAGARRVLRVRLFETLVGGGLIVGLFVIWSLVARRIRQQGRQLAAYNAQLEANNADLDAFAGRVAHDLKSALGPVGLTSSMLRSASTDPSRVLEIADRTERSTKRAIAVLDALLAFSRGGTHDETRESGELRPAVKRVLDELAPEVARLDASVEVEELPDLSVRCNPDLLHVVLSNLCGNAVKFLEGRDERRVRISARREDASCRIEIEDTGIGIPSEARERIFEPFYRVAGTRASGTGIGLATVRRIVDARGGRVAVESAEGRGSRFLVWLPVAEAPGDQPPPLGLETRI